MNEKGQVTIPKALRDIFGLSSESDLDAVVSKDGILIKPASNHREQVSQWLKDEHGSEMASLTTEQIMHLIQ